VGRGQAALVACSMLDVAENGQFQWLRALSTPTLLQYCVSVAAALTGGTAGQDHLKDRMPHYAQRGTSGSRAALQRKMEITAVRTSEGAGVGAGGWGG
jgi:hypothetical protein